ncbi:MAG: dethiobiotin synthase [Legionellaceae bacterium]|nr:dethiobiotin synthase [Legionellaceae bacterium]
MPRYFITGTDTNCGKTWITAQLVQFMRTKGHQSLAIKPLVSGVTEGTQDHYADIACLQQANAPDERSIHRWAWPEPISPHLAAALHQDSLSACAIADYCQSSRFSDIDMLFIEGAGGIMVPLNASETWIDVWQKLSIQVILVVAMRLGCLNHALLSYQALQDHQIPCVGWIANCMDPEMLFLEENITSLQNRLPVPCLAISPWAGKLDDSLERMGYNLILNSGTIST